jgi:decaprenylphospho-beta-D-erythro-pentofuranosid-2-ulose 2-reductase
MKNILIIGATSDMALACAEQFAKRGCNLILSGRRLEPMQEAAEQIRLQYGREVRVEFFEALNYERHAVFLQKMTEILGGLDGVLVAYGYLGEQKLAQVDWQEAQKIIEVNFTSVVSLLNVVANDFEKKRSGFICGISSVAGDRGRQSNYFYGSSKSALSVYLQGLRNRLSKSHVQVLTVKPGYVATKMISGHAGTFLVAHKEEVAAGIVQAIVKKKDVVYLPWFWKYIMRVIRFVPESIFKRLHL